MIELAMVCYITRCQGKRDEMKNNEEKQEKKLANYLVPNRTSIQKFSTNNHNNNLITHSNLRMRNGCCKKNVESTRGF